MKPHTIVWNGGNINWKLTRHVHLTNNDSITLCGLKICGYYETNNDFWGIPTCKHCFRDS